jgi:hypothetical protein
MGAVMLILGCRFAVIGWDGLENGRSSTTGQEQWASAEIVTLHM